MKGKMGREMVMERGKLLLTARKTALYEENP